MSVPGNSWTANWGPVPLRLVVGLVFVVHGAQKLFVFGLGGAAGFMGKVGIPLPFLAAGGVAAAGLLGGAGPIPWWGTPSAAALPAVHMLLGLLVGQLRAGVVGGFEFSLTPLCACPRP